MSGKIKALCVLGALCPTTLIVAQPAGTIPQAIEELIYRSESEGITDDYMEIYEKSQNLKVNLNTSSREQLEESGLFTPFQVHQLLRYRKQYGPFFSIYELAVLPGFLHSQLQVMEPFLEVHAKSGSFEKNRKNLLLMWDIYKSHPESMAYQEYSELEGGKKYAGSPLHTLLRIKSQLGTHLLAGLTYEKDAGETLFYRNRPQFLSGYLSFRGKGFMKQVVAGTYRLNHGLGLVNGCGFFHDPAYLIVNQQTISRLSPNASKTEQRYNRGLACEMGGKSLKFLLWASHTHLDLSPLALEGGTKEKAWWLLQRNTGLHRSSSELKGRDLGSRMNAGFQLLFRHNELALGIMCEAGILSLNHPETAKLWGSYSPVKYRTASMQGLWLRGRWNFFGELAIEKGPTFAFQMGTHIQFNDFVRGTLLAFHYDKDYTGSLPSSYPSGIQPKNEQGLAFHLHMEAGPKIQATGTWELVQYPSPRYGCLVPSYAYRLRLNLQNHGSEKLGWRIRLRSKLWQYTPDAEISGIRPLEEYRQASLDLRIKHQTSPSFEWQARLVISFLSNSQKRNPAYAFLQEAKMQFHSNLMGKIQFVLFHVDNWENRIYLHEPGFYYDMSFPSYYGLGQKSNMLITLKAFRVFTLSAKISGISYWNKENIGSGNDLTPGNKRWETGLQIRLKL